MRVEQVVYGVDDLSESARFFTDLGLEPLESSDSRCRFATQAGQLVDLRRSDDPGLPAPVEAGNTMREVVWGVDTEAAYDELVRRLGVDRPVSEFDGVAHCVDETGFGVAIAIADVKPLTVDSVGDNRSGAVNRWNRARTHPGRVRPLRICHVAVNIPKAGKEDALRFYVDRLDMRVTDQVRDMGVFLRAAGDSDQHTFLLCHRPDKASVNHTAFEVPGFDEVVVGVNNMVEQGWREARKLGRHTVGSNVFRFVHAPCGGRVELAADMDRVDETYGPNFYEQTPPHHIWQLEGNQQPGGES